MVVEASPANIAEAVSALQKKYPKITVVSSTNSFLTATYQRTPKAHVKVKVTLTFPDGYSTTSSSTPMVAGIEGVTIAPGLKKKLEKELGELCKGQEEGTTKSTFHQIDTVLNRLVEFIDTNRFVPCWKELRQVVELINNKSNESSSAKPDTIGLNESKGLIRLTFHPSNGKYHYKCSIVIDPAYPNTTELVDYGKACKLKMDSTNIPAPIEQVITSQAEELVRRLQDGMSEQQALIMSNPVHLPLATNNNSSSSSTEETPAEIWQREESARLRYYNISGGPYDGSRPKSSLLCLVTFLRRTIYHIIVEAICPLCHEKCIPVDPEELALLYKVKAIQAKRRRRPCRVHCGHWYHTGCMDQVMTEPPFGIGATCCSDNCDKQLYHPDWPLEAAANREQLYHQRQAKEREIADAADCF